MRCWIWPENVSAEFLTTTSFMPSPGRIQPKIMAGGIDAATYVGFEKEQRPLRDVNHRSARQSSESGIQHRPIPAGAFHRGMMQPRGSELLFLRVRNHISGQVLCDDTSLRASKPNNIFTAIVWAQWSSDMPEDTGLTMPYEKAWCWFVPPSAFPFGKLHLPVKAALILRDPGLKHFHWPSNSC